MSVMCLLCSCIHVSTYWVLGVTALKKMGWCLYSSIRQSTVDACFDDTVDIREINIFRRLRY